MTIQISIVIWTIICFILLMIILHNFLFKPVLKVIDGRKQRLEAARKKEKEQNEKIEAHKAEILRQRAEYALEKEQLSKKVAEQLSIQGKFQIEEAQKKRIKDVDDYRILMDESYGQIISSVSKEMNTVAELFASRIVSHRE